MKRIFFISILFLCFTACKKHTLANNESIENKDTLTIDNTKLGIEMLKEFYYSCYVNEKNFNDNDLKRKFVSTTILKRIDSFEEWRKSYFRL